MDQLETVKEEKTIPEINIESVGGSTKKSKKETAAPQDLDADYYIPKAWKSAPGQGCGEKCDLCCFKCIFYFPVVVTFLIFAFLVAFYVYAYLYPTLIGDYDSTLGLPDYWSSNEEKEKDQFVCLIILIIFIFLALQLLIAIILTINTDPGRVPQDREYDLPDSMVKSRPDKLRGSFHSSQETQFGFEHERLLNDDIVLDMQYPSEINDFDFGFLASRQGQMFNNEYKDVPDNSEQQKKKQMMQKKKQAKFLSIEQKKHGGVRLCQRCLIAKPDRTHHCRQCNRCVLKMDHHCPWVANCIGFYNQKYFLNMLFYASLTSLLVVITAYPPFIAVVCYDGISIGIAYFVILGWILTATFCLVITGFFCFHMYLLSNQYTTIEWCEKRSKTEQFKEGSPYDRGCYSNFTAVLGKNVLLWCCLFNRNLEGEGFVYEVREDIKRRNALSEPTESSSSSPSKSGKTSSQMEKGGTPMGSLKGSSEKASSGKAKSQ